VRDRLEGLEVTDLYYCGCALVFSIDCTFDCWIMECRLIIE
jgi:hypothetical protein